MPEILLCTLNAQYIHSSFALRYLRANLKELQAKSEIKEFTIKDHPLKIVEEVLALNPSILGLSIYIWNTQETLSVIKLLKQIRPNIKIVLGGPEVSYEYDEQEIVQLADHVIIGEGEISFYHLCLGILENRPSATKVIHGKAPDVTTMVLPYSLYTEEDIQNRILYVEASRGCPFRCQFCLSSLDKKVRNIPLDKFLSSLQSLIDRGARQFKFIDRTFNLSTKISVPILKFFLQQPHDDLFLHFEMIPDRFPTELRQWILQFPPGSVQFEVGIQSFNSEVTARIHRKQNNEKAIENLMFLGKTGIHLHTDLIIGLPGEDLQSFGHGFDRLIKIGVEEIQVGILKRLRGAPIALHSKQWSVVYSPEPPYEILQNKLLSFEALARLRRFARYWNIIGNSGRFKYIGELFRSADSPFEQFLHFSDWLFSTCGRTHKISYQNMLGYLLDYWVQDQDQDPQEIRQRLCQDYALTTGKRNPPHFLKGATTAKRRSGANRQQRHLKQL